MDITKLSTEELLEELRKRNETQTETDDDKNTVLVFGTIGIDQGHNFVEIFKKIEKPTDLDFLQQVSLRARFNSHRFYTGFYFKTDKFEELNKNLNDNNEDFADWIRENKKVKFIGL